MVQLYPNPATEQATIRMSLAKAAPVSLQVCDYTGRVVARQSWQLSSGSHSLALDMTQLSPGMYMVLINCQGRLSSLPLLKQ